MTSDELMSGLPGEALVRSGLADLESGRHTIHATLVTIARPRLVGAGLWGATNVGCNEPERELYRQLLHQGGDAYSRYNALLRELVSFEQALDRRVRAITPSIA